MKSSINHRPDGYHSPPMQKFLEGHLRLCEDMAKRMIAEGTWPWEEELEANENTYDNDE